MYQKSADLLEEYFVLEEEDNIMEMLNMNTPHVNMMSPAATDSSSLWNNTSETP